MTRGRVVVWLFIASLACFVGAVFIYSKAEDNTMVRFEQAAKAGEVDAKTANEKCDTLDESIKALKTQLDIIEKAIETDNDNRREQLEHVLEVNRQATVKTNGEVDILKIRQTTLDKKISGLDRTVNFKLDSKPIQIEIVQTKPAGTPPPPKKESLLKRSGVTP